MPGEATGVFGSFNLPGRFGFGRTGIRQYWGIANDMFQSARQIWVWPNLGVALAVHQRLQVSICQADLGLAELP